MTGNSNKRSRLLPGFFNRSGLSREEYDSIVPAMERSNYHTLVFSSALAAVLLGGMSVASLFIAQLVPFRPVYIAMAVVFLFFSMAAWLFVDKHRSLSVFFLYGLVTASYVFGTLIGTYMQPKYPATSFIVLLFAMPLFIVDKPYRFVILNILATVGFCVCSYQTKSYGVFINDLVNSTSFLVLGVALNIHFMRTKLRDLLNQNYIEHERDTDSLTGLLTHSAGIREVRAYMRGYGEPAALLILDVDDFKFYNDTYGHICGDAILAMIGDALRNAFRNSDTLMRMGGDEFVVFLPRIPSREQIDFCLRRLYDKVRSDPRGAVHPVTVSVGVALFPADAMDYDMLFAMADKALYASKGAGKNRVSYFSDLASE